MKEYKTGLLYSVLLWKEETRKVYLYLLLGLLFSLIQFCYPGVADYLRENGQRQNIWELYVWFMSTRQSQTFYLMAVIVLACQSLSIHAGTAFFLIRMSRKSWITGQLLNLFYNIIGLNLLCLLFCLWADGGCLMWGGSWSDMSFIASQTGGASFGIRELISVPFGVLSYNPWFIGGITFILSVLIGMLTGILMLIFTLKERQAYGAMLLLSLWFLDILAFAEPYLRILRYVLPFGLSRMSRLSLDGGGLSVRYALLFLFLSCLLLIELGIKVCQHVDYAKLE